MSRYLTNGRFESREELEAWVWHLWEKTPACQADIARQCRVSPGTVSKILDKGKPTMTDKLVAIVRFKNLKGVSPDTRFAAFESPDHACGPKGNRSACAFVDNVAQCEGAACEGYTIANAYSVYFKEILKL